MIWILAEQIDLLGQPDPLIAGRLCNFFWACRFITTVYGIGYIISYI